MTAIRVAVACVFLSLSGQISSPTASDFRWLEENREAALDAVMPLRPSPWPLVVYRSYRDLYYDVTERYVRIDSVSNAAESPSADIVVPIGKSVQEQLLEAHMREPNQDVSSLMAAIRVRRMTLTEADCPRLRERVRDIPTLRLSVADSRRIFLHPVLHRILVNQSGADIDVTVTDAEHPLARWANHTYEVLRACTPADRTQPTPQ